jgi:hypothetical protein
VKSVSPTTSVRQYLLRVVNATSQWLNVVLLLGEPNESISGRAYRTPWPRARRAIDRVFLVLLRERNHCEAAYFTDLRWAKAYQARHEDSKTE